MPKASLSASSVSTCALSPWRSALPSRSSSTRPISGTIAYRYLIGAGWLRVRLRFARLAATQSQAARRLVTEREAIIAELERARQDYLAATKGSSF